MQSNFKRKGLPQSFVIVILLMSCFHHQMQPVSAVVHSVLIYKQLSAQLGQLVTSSTLVWESYSGDSKQLEFAIKGGNNITDDVHYPIHVCRVNVEGVYASGQTSTGEKQIQKHVCIITHLRKVQVHSSFDVLVNKGHLGKVSWKPWTKFSPGTPIGAISVGDVDYSFVARHASKRNPDQIYSLDYNLGRLDTTIGLGKVYVTEGVEENSYNEGEVLVETEPFRYELSDIILDDTQMDIKSNATTLASAVLSNDGDDAGLIETVMSYFYDEVQYWGTHEGVARGLPTKVIDKNASAPTDINWGLRYLLKRIETKTVSTNLLPGAALNVTLIGNYTTIEAPYTAKLTAFYKDSPALFSRKISSTVKKATLTDIKLEFSPIYWTRPTTTTAQPTHKQTVQTTKGPTPIHDPPIVYMAGISKSSVSTSISSAAAKDDPNPINDDNLPLKDNPDKDNLILNDAANLKHSKEEKDSVESQSNSLTCNTGIAFYLISYLFLYKVYVAYL